MTGITDLAQRGLSALSDWWNSPSTEPAAKAAEPVADANAHANNDAEAAAEAARARPVAQPHVQAPQSLEDARQKVDEISSHFRNVADPLAQQALRDSGAAPAKQTEHDRVMKMKLETAILSLRDRIENVQKKAQQIVHEADLLKMQVKEADDKLSLITQIRSRLQVQANGRGELDLTQDRVTKQLLENARNLKILTPEAIDNLTHISREKRDSLMTLLKDSADEIKRGRDTLNDEINKKTKEAYKQVEIYNECWKMLKKAIDDLYQILKKITRGISGAAG